MPSPGRNLVSAPGLAHGGRLRKQWSKRHGAAVKQGIKKAKARKRVVKQATLALRKAPSKQAIVQGLFTPKSPREAEVEAEAEAEAEEMAEETR